MKYSAKAIGLLLRLRDGELVNAGEFSSERLKDLKQELERKGAVSFSRRGTVGGRYMVPDRNRFIEACGQIDSTLSDLDAALRLARGDVSSRGEKVALFGNSKQEGADRTVRGFTLLADRKTEVSYLGEVFHIGPQAGLHVVDRKALILPEGATVVIVENAECLYDLGWIPNVGLDTGAGPYVVLCRFPFCEEAKLWLEGLPNRILYFGDYDLAGIRIYESEFKRRLGDRVSFILPEDLEGRIRRSGNPELYTRQVNEGFASVASQSGELTGLITLLHSLHSGYEQEGYCLP